jgi:hypothetical protein
MPRGDDRDAARRLAAVLDGAEPGDADLATVARVLRDAAAAARLEVADDEVERALERARPRAPRDRAPRSRLRVAGVMLGVAVVLGVVIVLALPFTSSPVTVDVQARALAALGQPGKVLSVAEVVRPGPGQSFPTSLRTGWIDIEGGRQRWTQSVGGTIVAETLVERGRVTRYDPTSGTAVVATSCAALASGCAEGVDPVVFYRRALAAAGPLRSSARDVDGRRVFRVVLPVQTLADRVRIVQVATIDAATYLPRRIEWRQVLAGGRERTFAEIVVRDIARADVSTEAPSVLDLELPPGTAITQVAAPGVPVRRLGERRLTVAEARALHPSPWWFGPAFRGRRLSEIVLVRYTGGTAVRIRYGATTIWTYGRVIPPPLLGAQVPLKTIPLGGSTGRFYETRGGILVGERSIPSGTIAVESPGNDAAYAALGSAKPLS